jgi:hypothetical protein
MALSASTLSAGIKSELQKTWPDAQSSAWLDAFCLAVATAVVDHIKNSAVVSVTSVSGVLAGPAVSGPGSGTIS